MLPSWSPRQRRPSPPEEAPRLRPPSRLHAVTQHGQAVDAGRVLLPRGRAESVRVYLESKGIDRNRLETKGFGETKPIDTNRTPAGRAKNRRVAFKVLRVFVPGQKKGGK